jgi:hypothetical protein
VGAPGFAEKEVPVRVTRDEFHSYWIVLD